MQTTYNSEIAIARKGMLADASTKVADSYVAEGNLTFGLFVQRGTLADQVQPIAALPAADDDSIVATPVASAATAFTVELADLDGVIGGGTVAPMQLLTMTLNNHADWDATTCKVTTVGPGGAMQEERFAIPNGGNVVLTGNLPFRQFIKAEFEAQTGTNGTVYFGTDPADVALDIASFPGVLLYDPGVESYAAATEIEDEKPVSVLSKGRVYVEVEEAVTEGDPVFVRMVEAGADLRGQVRGTPAANFYRFVGAKFLTAAAADGLAVMQIGA